jgi:predicted anti-sigma-YlaC factor YlaD
MTCDDLELRLYDEDCRRALLGAAPAPADVRDHLVGCAACREVWTEAARDTLRLTHDLLLKPPPALIKNLVPSTTQPLAGWYDVGTAVAAGALLSIVAALIPGADPLWQWTGFWTGAACGFAASVIDRNIPLPPLVLPG